jgi:hypothetical protein
MLDDIILCIRFYWLCIKDAARGSLALANAWAWLVGAIIIGSAAEYWGLRLRLPENLQDYFSFGLMLLGATWIAVFVIRLIGAPSRLYWAERRNNDISTSFLVGEHIYAESKWVKWQDGSRTGLYETGFYLQISNALSNGKTLERVQARIFLTGEPVLARVKETGDSEIDIRHGELALFQIGSLVSKEMHGLIEGGVEIDDERRKTFEHNIPLGVLSFEVWDPSGKRAYGLGHLPANPGKFTLIVIVSANDVVARHIPITINLTKNDPVSYSS